MYISLFFCVNFIRVGSRFSVEYGLKDYVILTSHRSKASYTPSNNVITMFSIGVVETCPI